MITQAHVFYLLASMAILGGFSVVLARNPVRAVLSLVMTFVATAGVWMLLETEFLAITLVLVYVGAVMVLFLFVVMMLDIEIAKTREGFTSYVLVGSAAAVAAVMVMARFLGEAHFGPTLFAIPEPRAADYSNVRALGEVLYTKYAFPFEVAAVLLLVAIVAAICLTFRGRQASRAQNPGLQVQVRKTDRLRVISMPVDKPTSQDSEQ